MAQLSRFLYRISRGWVALAALIIFIVFSLLTLPGQNALAEEYSQGMGSPDTSLFYKGTDLYRMAEMYGQEGRAAYLRARWTFDLAFPFVYTFFLAAAISWSLNRVLPQGSRWRLLNLVPVAAMVLDFLENTAASLVMARYPVNCPPGELLAPLFTPLKWLFVGGSFATLTVAVMITFFRRK
ncbi:MAG TPA: hypothetical protein PKK59_08770 [Anaerolineaceae bacterium]|nr:hypothetical protein [Anaerolineaceae bacterium]